MSEDEEESLFVKGVEIDNPLKAFEDALHFLSLRKAMKDSQRELLLKGVEPENLTYSYVENDIYQTLINPEYTLQIEDEIYFERTGNLTLVIPNKDEAELASLRKGNSFDANKIRAIARIECGLDFSSSNSYRTSLSGDFSLTGGIPDDVTIAWDFGDGTKDETNSPIVTKTYTKSGTYHVCVKITSPSCSQTICKDLRVRPESCIADFKSAFNPDLRMTFTDNSFASSGGTIEKWEWDFGDGTTATGSAVSHKYAKSCFFTVLLKITVKYSWGGTCIATNTSTILPKSDNFCCDEDLDKFETRFTHVITPNERKLVGTADLNNTWIGKDRVRAVMDSYKKGTFGNWYWSKQNIKVEVEGNMYDDENACPCEVKIDVSGSEERNSFHLKYIKKVENSLKIKKQDPWSANFYHQGNLIKTIVFPVISKKC